MCPFPLCSLTRLNILKRQRKMPFLSPSPCKGLTIANLLKRLA